MAPKIIMNLALIVGFGFAAPSLAQDVDVGETLYQDHCSDCHGSAADGKGPLANAMIMKPNDLTRLTADNDGVFPMLRVVKRVDGREPLVSHGSPMPVYGQYFEGKGAALKTAAGQPIITSSAIADLVAFLQGVQQ